MTKSLRTLLIITACATLAAGGVTVWFDAVEAPASLYIAVMSVITAGGGALMGVFGLRS